MTDDELQRYLDAERRAIMTATLGTGMALLVDKLLDAERRIIALERKQPS